MRKAGVTSPDPPSSAVTCVTRCGEAEVTASGVEAVAAARPTAQLASATVGHLDAAAPRPRPRPRAGTSAGRLGWPRWGTGARYGESVSTSSRSSGHSAAAGAHVVGRLEGDDAAEGQMDAEVEASTRLVGAAGEAVEHRALGHALGGQDVERVGPRLAGVDDQGQVVVVGQRDLLRRTPRAGPRGASGRSGSRARTRPPPRPRARPAARRCPRPPRWRRGDAPRRWPTPRRGRGPPRWPGGSARRRCRR